MGDSHPQLGVNLKHLRKTTLNERKLILDGSIFYFDYGRKGTILFKVSETSTIRHNISNISQAGIVPTQLGNFCEPRSRVSCKHSTNLAFQDIASEEKFDSGINYIKTLCFETG